MIQVQGDLAFAIRACCDRCGEKMTNEMRVAFDECYSSEMSNSEAYFYSGNEIDLRKAIEDNIVLSLPSQFLCKEDCLGLCPVCGMNLNQSICSCNRETIKDSPFGVLQNLELGGAKNGSTKKKDF